MPTDKKVDKKICDYPNCHDNAVRRVADKDLCTEHADGFTAVLQQRTGGAQ